MIKKFAVPRGTTDILPEFVSSWENIENKARRLCKSYGYREIRTPIYEDANLFKRSLGQTSDVVNKQLLELASSKEDEAFALRPEGTAAVVRSYIENNFDGRESLSKFFYLGPMFRGERPQKGRLRQFHQIGAEAIGPGANSFLLDVEMIAMAINLLKNLGVQAPLLKINSLGSVDDKAHIAGWLREQLAKQKDHLCEECQGRFERNIFRVLDCKKEACRKIVSVLVVDLPLSKESQEYFQGVCGVLTSLGINFDVSPHLVRGLDYYTHTVFEITAQGLGSQDAVGAGGRYNGLVHQLGGNEKVNYGAVGFALGIERILLNVGSIHESPNSVDIFAIAMKTEYLSYLFKIVEQLRQVGIRSDLSFSGGSMKSQMGKADKSHARFTLILGEDEFQANTLVVKDMKNGTQEVLGQAGIVEALEARLK